MTMNKAGFRYGRHAVTLVTAVMLLLLYMLIFSFSSQNGEQSGSLSYRISEQCVEIVSNVSGKNWTEMFKQELAANFEHPIRKLAHFAEYACMGILVYTMWRPWKKRGGKLYLLVILWVFLSAVGDEIHQLYVPDRYGGFSDVILDTCGGIFGLGMCVLFDRLFIRHTQ